MFAKKYIFISLPPPRLHTVYTQSLLNPAPLLGAYVLYGWMLSYFKNSSSPRSSPKVSSRCLLRQSSLTSGQNMQTSGTSADTLTNLGGNVLEAFSGQRPASALISDVCCMRNNLLVAADSVTDAMSSLVKELNSGRNNVMNSKD